MSEQGQTRNSVETQVLQRAAQDAQFRQDLIQNPRHVIGTQLGVDIPQNIQIQVLEETPTTFYLVLPPAQAATGQELSEMDLAGVAGGWTALTECDFGSCGGTCPVHGCPTGLVC